MKYSRHGLVCAGMLVALAGRAATAQTKFVIRDSTVRLAKYTTVEECLALAKRLQAQYAIRKDTSRYATPRREFPTFEPHPRIAVDWSRTCMAKFRADTAPIDTANLWNSATLHWETGYLFARDFASVKTIRDKQVAALRDSAVGSALEARRELYKAQLRPVDLDLLDEVDRIAIAEIQKRGKSAATFLASVDILHKRVERRWEVGQRPQAESRARELLAFMQSFNLTEGERAKISRFEEYGLVEVKRLATQRLEHQLLFDSLRIGGPAAYDRVKIRIWKDAGGEMFAPIVGRPARRIAASFVFPRGSRNTAVTTPATNADSSIPASNKVTLLVFLNNACREESRAPSGGERALHGGQCWDAYGMIRRFARQFPSLDITIVTPTMGLIGNQLTNDPAEEAELIRSLWHGYHQLPANIGVVHTPFFRLAAPDNRRVDKALDYVQHYFGRDFFPFASPIPEGFGFIVVPGRTVLEYKIFREDTELELREILAPLMEWYDRWYVPPK